MAARGHDGAQRHWSACAMPGTSAAALAFSGSMTLRDDRDAGRADLLALVAGDAIENAGQRQRTGDLRGIVARIERGLAELNERRRAGEIREVAEPDHRAGRVAAHAADAIERLRGVLHLLVLERLGEAGIGRRRARATVRASRPCDRTARDRPPGRGSPEDCAAARSSCRARPLPSRPALRGRSCAPRRCRTSSSRRTSDRRDRWPRSRRSN